jgi:glycosyltransferase involved in cell wall biosynthesis
VATSRASADVKVVYAVSVARGGPLTHVLELAPRVAACGVDVTVLSSTRTSTERARGLGLDAVLVPLDHKFDVRGAAAAWRHIAQADIVHTHDRRTGLLVRAQARVRGPRPVHTFHGLPEEIFARVGRPDARTPPGVSRAREAWLMHGLLRIEALLSYLGTVVVPSAALAQFLGEHGFPRNRLHVIPNGVELGERAHHGPREPVVVVCAALLERRKGVDVLLEAAAIAQAPLRLEILGDGPERAALEARAQELGLDAHFAGYVDDVRERLREADIFVLPARAENLPMAILEAMATGLPVVSTRVGGNAELIEDQLTGLLVEPDDAAALAGALDQLASDPASRSTMGNAGFERVREKFEAGAMARRMVDLYTKLCESST